MLDSVCGSPVVGKSALRMEVEVSQSIHFPVCGKKSLKPLNLCKILSPMGTDCHL